MKMKKLPVDSMYTTEHIYFCLGINGLSHNTHRTVHGK